MCECQQRHEADRVMWLTVRRALLSIAAAIAKRYDAERETKQVRRVA